MPTTSDIDNVDHSVRYDGDDSYHGSLAPTSFLSTDAWQQVPRSLTKSSNLIDFAQCELDVLMVDPGRLALVRTQEEKTKR